MARSSSSSSNRFCPEANEVELSKRRIDKMRELKRKVEEEKELERKRTLGGLHENDKYANHLEAARRRREELRNEQKQAAAVEQQRKSIAVLKAREEDEVSKPSG